MTALEIIRLVLLAIHILGLAAIVGTFFVQMRASSGFRTDLMVGGAVVQLVTGLALVGIGEAGDGDMNHVKVGVKLVIALVVLVTSVLAARAQKRDGKVKPFFHAAGGLAIVNVLVAVLWQ
ncbi:MAG: hypothetical protein ABW040_08710 [Microbacteriaceae bacterium]